MSSDEHHLTPTTRFEDTIAWLAERDLIGAIAEPPRGAAPVLLIGRPGGVPVMAVVGNTLCWDGQALAVHTTGETP